ncbi:MAG: SDR family NAD(P)-dependent oxidoreductase, partial [Acidobacteriota bacterium]|nr:SDR family NAD(P)-dependent oxidoreductase [Acidobacteriota bacterium]
MTGASRGIGRAIALRLARDGASVILAARDAMALAQAAAEIQAAGGAAHALALDLRLPDTPSRLAAYAIERTGRIDIVVNNAGATRRGLFPALSDEEWLDGFALKFFG